MPNEPVLLLENLQRIERKPGDLFVLNCDFRVSDVMRARIAECIEQWAGIGSKVLVLEQGMRIGVVGEPEA